MALTEFDFHELANRIEWLKEKGYTFEISASGSSYITGNNVVLIPKNVTWESLEGIISTAYFNAWKPPLKWLEEMGIKELTEA